MIIEDKETIVRAKGKASTILADEFIPYYAERVEKFLKDNQKSMGDKWVEEAGKILYNFQGKDDEGTLLDSSTTMGVAISTFCPEIPLITGQQLLRLYSQAGNKNPFKNYIDFGVQINGNPKTNPEQAKIILEEFKKGAINLEQGKVIDFNQLRLVADKNAGLAYKLSKNFGSKDFANSLDYPFTKNWIGKNGLFGAFLSRDSYWCADFDNLHDSNDSGRVVRYDAEGVMPQKLPAIPPKKKDLIETLKDDFLSRF